MEELTGASKLSLPELVTRLNANQDLVEVETADLQDIIAQVRACVSNSIQSAYFWTSAPAAW
jgi:hypothetical protein